MSGQDKRGRRLKLLDDPIGQHLRASDASGERREASSWGQAARLRRRLRPDAGVLPREVGVMREAAALEAQLASCGDEAARRALRQRIAGKRQAIALRLEKLRVSGSL